MDEFILSTNYQGKWHYWIGKGQFTTDPNKAKKYPSWQMADYWAGRIKRWKMMYCTLQEELERLTEVG